MGSRAAKTAEELRILWHIKQKAKEEATDRTAKYGRSTSMTLAKNQLFIDEIERLFEAHPFPKVQPYKPTKKQKTQRILNLMLSDLHYGADLNEHETGHRYSPVEEARRTAAVVKQAADYKRHYRDETILYVHLMGDLIQGKLHDPEDAAPLTEQYYRAVWNLGQAVAFLSTQFKEVQVYCTPGNHGRRKDRHHDRPVNQKWDSIERMIYAALAAGMSGYKNVKIIAPLTPYYIFDAFGQKGFMTHGDTVLKPGYPGNSIDVGGVRKQINEINLKQKCNLYGVGHVHTASATRLPNGVVFLTNGCLLPSDEFAQSIGIMETACCQQLWESVPGFIFGDRRDAIVDENTDKDSSLDKIVKPFPGMPHIDIHLPAALARFTAQANDDARKKKR